MKIGLHIADFTYPSGPAGLADDLTRIAAGAEEAGFARVSVMDHVWQIANHGPPEHEMLEAYTTLGYLAARTSRVDLLAWVTAATYRAPGMLVKMVSTLDVLSGGRAWLGVGAGYQEEEARAMDLPLPPLAERFDRLDETLQLALHMWSGDSAPFERRYLHLQRPLNNPPALRKPHPPILIGGMGERKTLRLVAEYADACNLFDIPDEGRTIKHKLEILARHCDAVGRPYEEIEKTVSTRLNPGESSEAFAERCAALAALGIEHAVVITGAPWTEDAVARLAAAQGR